MKSPAFRRVFIANRGEIALRVIRTCRELGIETVLGASEADRETLPARWATRSVVIGPARATDSYLDVELAVHTALMTGCDAIHPGFGFLSENPQLAELCSQHGITFIGPDARCLRLLGDKVQAREVAKSLGLAVLSGGPVKSVDEALRFAVEIGYPLMLKASAGGGGRGIRIIEDATSLKAQFDVASAEAESAFGDGRLHVETYLRDARHVEVQIIGDRHETVLALGERDCSIQYNYQKVIEEAPCAMFDDSKRDSLCRDAIALLSSQNYVGLGTVEFLYEPLSGRHFFLEVNPRIQVEHPVTEMITGRDLVADQIAVVSGAKLPSKDEIALRGHAIEFRLNAQAPHDKLRPSPGQIETLSTPGGPYVRWDSHCYAGYRVPPFYDAMLGKLIVWGADRDTALRRGRRALAEFVVEGAGLKTNLELLKCLAGHPDIVRNQVSTTWLNEFMASF